MMSVRLAVNHLFDLETSRIAVRIDPGRVAQEAAQNVILQPLAGMGTADSAEFDFFSCAQRGQGFPADGHLGEVAEHPARESVVGTCRQREFADNAVRIAHPALQLDTLGDGLFAAADKAPLQLREVFRNQRIRNLPRTALITHGGRLADGRYGTGRVAGLFSALESSTSRSYSGCVLPDVG